MAQVRSSEGADSPRQELALPELVGSIDKLPGWRVRSVFTTDPSFATLRLKRLVVEADEDNPNGTISRKVLEAVRIGELQTAAQRLLRHAVPAPATTPSTRSKPGRKVDTWPPLELAKIARRYVQLWESGKRPVYERLVEEWPDQTEASIRTAIKLARKRTPEREALLTETSPGVGGGKLTPRGKAELRKGKRS